MPAATLPPPSTTPTIQPSAPKPGPSAVPVGAMPTPPSVDSRPADAPAKADDFPGFDKYAKSPEEGLVHGKRGTEPEKPAEVKAPESPKPEEKPAEAARDEDSPIEELEDGDETAAKKPEEKPEPADEKTKDGKPSLGKLYRTEKSRADKLEQEVTKLKSLIKDPEAAKAEVERFAQIEKQNKELLEHIRLTDYAKHPEYAEKFEKPYNDAWMRLMKRISGVGVNTAEGGKRPVEPADILKLSSLPADQVIEQSEAMFGKLGNFVAERVEELKTLWENKAEALDRARKEGAEKITKAQQDHERQQSETMKFLKETFDKSVQEIEQHSKYGRYFKPVEGDEDHNTRLEKGTKFVDENWHKDPRDPNLSNEDRAKIVKAHAAIRNRARAFGVLNLAVKRQEAELSRLKAELAQYKQSTPPIDGQRIEQTNGAPAGNTLNTVLSGFDKYARPGPV